MNPMEQLVRLQEWTVEERRRRLNEVEALADRLRRDLAALDTTLEQEARAAESSLEARRTFPSYAAVMKQRRERLLASVREVEKEIAKTQEELTVAYQDMKKTEITVANRKARRRRDVDRREQAVSDEIGANIVRRRGE
jgi:flagellar export protein FliJ